MTESNLGGIRDRLTLVTAGAWFNDRRYDYDESGSLVYEGYAEEYNTGTSESEWYIWKYVYDTNGNFLRKQGPLKGSWYGRHTLAWSEELCETENQIENTELATNDLLLQVLNQLKITNFHLSILTDHQIDEQEIV
jgi:hypothetical protein